MATTVNNAFNEFMGNTINLNSNQTKKARISRDNLITNINSFSNDDFFDLYTDKSLRFGSFERHTKLKPLDDIDLMICISGGFDRYYCSDSQGNYYIIANSKDKKNKLNSIGKNEDYLNSTKVINKFISKLSNLNDYNKAEMHKNHEAATLKLKSYDWNFDIVPCFYTKNDFYLIPNGTGNWKKTDPRIDNERSSRINQKHNGNLLPLIRLIKYWNKHNSTFTIASYILECLILNRYERIEPSDTWWIDLEFERTLSYMQSAILRNINDPKGIQGNLNYFSQLERYAIKEAIGITCKKINEAKKFELNAYNQEMAIKKWGEVFGLEFPRYNKE